MPLKVAIVDDHNLVRKGISNLLTSRGYDIVAECSNGQEILDVVDEKHVDIIFMDLQMPLMNGWEATKALTKKHPAVQVIALSMFDDDASILKMIRAGARGYLLKDAEPDELVRAINDVVNFGYHTSEYVSGRLVKSAFDGRGEESEIVESLSDRELEFLKWSCTELTYRAIADEMCVSPRTVDGYRDDLFRKLDIKSRVGLVLFAIRHKLIEL